MSLDGRELLPSRLQIEAHRIRVVCNGLIGIPSDPKRRRRVETVAMMN
jgi:hypothetical protein